MKKLICLLLALCMLPLGSLGVFAKEEVTTVFNITFENGKVGSQPVKGVFLDTMSGVTESTAKKNYVRIAEVDGNKVLHLECKPDAEKGAGIRGNRSIDLTGYTNMTLSFKMKSNGAGGSMRLYTTDENEKAMTTKVYEAAPQDWEAVEVVFDFKNMTYTTKVNGKVTESDKALKFGRPETAQLRMMTYDLVPGTGVYFDDIVVTTTDKLGNDWGPLMGNNQVDWNKVVPEKPLSKDSFVNNLKQHPRVFVRSWDEMRAKIDATYETRQWYGNLKKAADKALASATQPYVAHAKGYLVLESARSARDRIQALAFVYNITGDKRYADKAYAEMIEMGAWPDWAVFNSALITAELLQGYACCYDWLYDYLTAEQKQNLIEIMKKQAFCGFIYHYEDATDWNVSKLSINWNPVCNTSNIMAALAIADEAPEISEYILEKAPPRIQYALGAYAPQGAYPEGVSYWDYGTTFVVYGNDLMENAFVEGFKVPDDYLYWKAPGIADTCDYAIYYDGPAGRFNYGDCAGGHTSCEIMYWAADRFDKPHYAWRQDAIQAETGKYLSGYPAITSLCWYNPEQSYLKPGAFTLDKFYQSDKTVNGASMRSSWDNDTALFAALQGGYNQANHQHWSLGTYVIDWNGKRFVRVLGEHDYDDDTDKNLIYYKRAEAYNVIVANPTTAPDQNKMAVARLIDQGTSDGAAYGVLDMTEVYATVKDGDKLLIPQAKRGIMLHDNRSRVLVQDEIKVAGPVDFYWFANTDAGIKISADGRSAILNMEGDEMLVRMVDAPSNAKFSIMRRKSLVEGVKTTTSDGTKLTIHLPQQSQDFNIAVEYVPLGKGEGIPAADTFVPIAEWKADENGKSAFAHAGSATVLKLDTPNAIANGVKTFIDTNNTDVVPFTQNGRTLVPVRFISESFGATVGWDDATQSVTVDLQDTSIKLAIGSDKMYVNGNVVTLDVPAQTINSRTLIPLRALVEALGKNVHWDDRGLIIIADDALEYSEEALSKMITELNVRVKADGKDVVFFTTDKTQYTVDVPTGGNAPTFTASTIGDEQIAVSAQDDFTVITIDGVAYTFRAQPDPFEGQLGTKDPGVATGLTLSIGGLKTPDYNTFIYVEDLVDSTGFESYPKRGIVDGVINTDTANRWAVNGEGWIQMDFGSVKNVYSMAFAGISQNKRAYKFDVLASEDGVNWTTVHTGGAPTTTAKMSILPLGNVQARYIKMVGKGNSENAWNTYAEVRFYESEAQQKEDKSYWGIYFASADAVIGKAGQSGKLTVAGVDADKKVIENLSATITYEIADTSIATITADGQLTFLKPGVTTITVNSTQKGIKLSSTVELVSE